MSRTKLLGTDRSPQGTPYYKGSSKSFLSMDMTLTLVRESAYRNSGHEQTMVRRVVTRTERGLVESTAGYEYSIVL